MFTRWWSWITVWNHKQAPKLNAFFHESCLVCGVSSWQWSSGPLSVRSAVASLSHGILYVADSEPLKPSTAALCCLSLFWPQDEQGSTSTFAQKYFQPNGQVWDKFPWSRTESGYSQVSHMAWPWRKQILPLVQPLIVCSLLSRWGLPSEIAPPMLACHLVLSLFRSCFGNCLVEVSWVRLPRHV